VGHVAHVAFSRALANTMVARMSIAGRWLPAGKTAGVRAGQGIAARRAGSSTLCIQAAMPWRINRARARMLGWLPSVTAAGRSAS
jgi:hypothetical protein